MADRVPVMRVSKRLRVVLGATCRTTSRRSLNVVLSDISAEGCCIGERGHLLIKGKRVVVRMHSLEGLPGVVCWVKGDRAGVRFDRPLYAPVLDHLVRTHASVRATINGVRAG